MINKLKVSTGFILIIISQKYFLFQFFNIDLLLVEVNWIDFAYVPCLNQDKEEFFNVI